MKVADIIDYAITGELRQVSLSDIGDVSARTPEQQKNLDTLVSYVNQAMIELSTRFPLFISVEELDADSGDTDPIPFPNNATTLLKVESLLGEVIPINEPKWTDPIYKDTDQWFVKTPSVNTLVINNNKPIESTELLATFVLSAPKYVYTSDIAIPNNYLEAVLDYIAYKANTAMKPLPNQEGNVYYMKFEADCTRLKATFDNNYDSVEGSKFFTRGFI
jgi:hypothetical protein